MKSSLLAFTLLFLSLSVQAQTSVYHPFPDSVAIWNFGKHSQCSPFMSIADYSVVMDGDTVISSQVYHKIYIPGVVISSGSSFCTGIITGYKGGIREDISAKKVYMIGLSGSEELLYDFNLQIGDTISGVIESWAGFDTVQSIDSVLIGSDYRKVWNINSCYNISIVEGIGSNYGLIVSSPGCATDMPYYTLNCFSRNDTTIFPNSTTNCSIISGINSIYKEKNWVTIHPNPFHTSTKIILDKTFSTGELKLFNLFGEIVYEEKFNNQQSK